MLAGRAREVLPESPLRGVLHLPGVLVLFGSVFGSQVFLPFEVRGQRCVRESSCYGSFSVLAGASERLATRGMYASLPEHPQPWSGTWHGSHRTPYPGALFLVVCLFSLGSISVQFRFSGFAVWVVSCGQVLSCRLSGLNRAPPSCGRALSLLARGVYEGTEEREARSFFCGAAMCVCNAVGFSLPGVVSRGVIDGWIWM